MSILWTLEERLLPLDESRLHTVHEGAVEVLKSGETLTIYPDQGEAWKGSEPGINLPIVFHENIIGVIGVTGDPMIWKISGSW